METEDAITNLLKESATFIPFNHDMEGLPSNDERNAFGAWYVDKSLALPHRTKNTKRESAKTKSKESESQNIRETRCRSGEKTSAKNGVKRITSSGSKMSSDRVLSTFRHLPETSDYIKNYKGKKDVRAATSESVVDNKPVKTPQGLPTTQIILNAASAIRKPRNGGSSHLRRGSSQFCRRSDSSETSQEQFVLCSPAKVVTYDCSTIQLKKDNGHHNTENVYSRSKTRKKVQKPLIKANIDLSNQNLFVTGVGGVQKHLSHTEYSKGFEQTKLGHFPIECHTSDQVMSRKSYLAGSEKSYHSPDFDPTKNTPKFMYSIYG